MKRRFLCVIFCTFLSFFVFPFSMVQAAVMEGEWQYTYLDGRLPSDSHELMMKRLLLPDESDSDTLLFSTVGQAVEIYVGNQRIYTSGTMGPVSVFGHGRRWHFVRLPLIHQSTSLTLRLYADTPHQLGKFESFSLASEDVQAEKVFIGEAPYIVAMPIVVLLLIILVTYYFNQAPQRALSRAIGVFLSLVAIWMFCMSNVRQFFFDAPVFTWQLAGILRYAMTIAANAVVYEIVEEEKKPKIKQILRMFTIGLLLCVVAEFLGMNGMYYGQIPLYVLIFLGECIVLRLLWQSAFQRENLYAKVALFPTVSITGLALIDGFSQGITVWGANILLLPFSVFALLPFFLCILREQMLRERTMAEQAVALEYKISLAVGRSEVDLLTGCQNRLAFNAFMEREVENLENRSFSLIMFDIDHFKSINDTFGHDVGDVVLKEFAHVIRQGLDKRWKFFRWGGEEFVLYCPDTPHAEVVALAETLRKQIEQANILPERKITTSAGVAYWHGAGDTSEKLFQRMDKALYLAKECGRNRVATESSLEEEKSHE